MINGLSEKSAPVLIKIYTRRHEFSKKKITILIANKSFGLSIKSYELLNAGSNDEIRVRAFKYLYS